MSATGALTGTLGKVGAAFIHRDVEVGAPCGDGWLAATDLLADGGAELDARLRAIDDAHGGGLPDVAASYFTGWYAGAVVAPTIGAFVIDRRVPDIGAANVSLHTDEEGWFDRTAVHRPAMTVLVGDPAAGEPGNRTVTELASLRAVLVTGIVAHLTPVVDAVRARAPLGLRALWGTVADSCAGAFLQVGRGDDGGAGSRAEADAFLAAASPPLRARPRWILVEHDGCDHTFMERGACCLAYKTADHGYCTSCPFTDDAERVQRLRTYLAEEAS